MAEFFEIYGCVRIPLPFDFSYRRLLLRSCHLPGLLDFQVKGIARIEAFKFGKAFGSGHASSLESVTSFFRYACTYRRNCTLSFIADMQQLNLLLQLNFTLEALGCLWPGRLASLPFPEGRLFNKYSSMHKVPSLR